MHKQERKHINTAITIFSTALFALCSACIENTSSYGESQNYHSSSIMTTTPSVIQEREMLSGFDEQDAKEIAYFEQALQQNNLDPTVRAGYEDQIQTIKYWMGRRATARALQITPQTVITPFADDPTSTPYPRGILPEGVVSQRTEYYYTVENGWTDGRIAVYAGGIRDEPLKGIVFVLEDTPEGGINDMYYNTPIDAGPIRIVSENNDVLLLKANNGQQFEFDIRNRVFIPNS